MKINPRQIQNLKNKIKEISEISFPHCRKGHADLTKINRIAHEAYMILDHKLKIPDEPYDKIECPICARHGRGHLGVCQS